MIIMGVFSLIMIQTGTVEGMHPILFFVIFSIMCIIIGSTLAEISGKRMFSPIIKVSEASKALARGDFSIRLDENKIRAKEVRLMAKNFNFMVNELQNNELFKNDFIENVSHEFKTPLSSIEGYVTLLQDDSIDAETKALYIQHIIANTKRLATLSDNILLLSRLEHQEISSKMSLYSLDEQIREILLLFESIWVTKNIELDIDLDTISFYGNPELLAQVWQNIIGNAMKFVSENGNIRIILRENQEFVKIEIVDNGIGMSENTKKRIYEKFYQADTSRFVPGNGLGLTLAKRIIDLHHGTIQVSSKEGKGTSFTIKLPKTTKI
jgi:signal transduction histidine kinase